VFGCQLAWSVRHFYRLCDFSNSHHHLNCFAIVYLSQNHYLYLEIHKNLVDHTGDGFDNGKQWQANLGGDESPWKNRPTHENGEYSMLIDINGDGLPDHSPFSCVGRFFQGDSSPPRLACHCLPLSKPSPVLR
jgi:hypothetical protein